MKLPIPIGGSLVFRVILPGIVLTAIHWPLVKLSQDALQITLQDEIIFGFLCIFFGYITTICDMHIYMILEGRCYWPRFIRKVYLKSEQNRLRDIERTISLIELNKNMYKDIDPVEFYIKLLQFPADKHGRRHAKYPTRLGNAISAYENYPRHKYGIDGIFYWKRILFVVDSDLRSFIDNRQSIVDGITYLSFSLLYGSFLMMLYSIASHIDIDLHFQISRLNYFFMSVILFVLFFVTYRISLQSHVQFGETVCAMFDVFLSRIELDSALERIEKITEEKWVSRVAKNEQLQIIWRYLRWHRFRPLDSERNLDISEFRRQKKGMD